MPKCYKCPNKGVAYFKGKRICQDCWRIRFPSPKKDVFLDKLIAKYQNAVKH